MKDVTIVYHHEDGVWWAESAEVPEFSAAADTFGEIRKLALEGIDFTLDGTPTSIREKMDDGSYVPSIGDETVKLPVTIIPLPQMNQTSANTESNVAYGRFVNRVLTGAAV
ncbi:MAG: hypothetical protein ABF489_00390 [Bifidobacterium sp.]|uniref:type II toxin-antitoxin system HicB family antitoxin n=1 Tax=Bifidobacterium sp. TaxID=41200 RepID=UPI0039EC4675